MSSCEPLQALTPTRNYTSEAEKDAWWYIKRWGKDNKSVWWFGPFWINKEQFRQRRSSYCYGSKIISARINFQNNNDIGAFCRLTNSYAIVGDEYGSENFSNTLKGDLPDVTIISTSVSSCDVVGRLCVGNSRGLLVPETINEPEFIKLQQELPDSVKVQKIDEKLSALGNVIACNDKVALIHPDISKENREIIENTLQVEVFPTMLGTNSLVGSYCVLNNNGGLIGTEISQVDLENLSALAEIPLSIGTINYGCTIIGSGLLVNEQVAYAGMKTTSHEFSKIDKAFQLRPVKVS